MKMNEIKSLSNDELQVKLVDMKQEFFNLRCQHGMGQLENTSVLSKIKKDIARVNTAIKALELSKG